MKYIAKAALLLAIMVTSFACEKKVEYKQQQTTLSNFTFPYKSYGDADFEITPPKSNSPEPFTYISSNTNVAIVFGNTIKIKNAGVTTIVATQKESDKFTQMAISADFRVFTPRPTLSDFPDIVKLSTDGTFTLPAPKSNSQGAFTYEVSDKNIATVSGNKLTIKRAGKTSIRVEQVPNGNYGLGVIVANLTVNEPPLTDIDGNVYKTVVIGNQIWMMENLRVKHYNDGSSIPNIRNNADWINATSGAYCSYNNDDSNIKNYGLLYNWYAATDKKQLAPKGWHIPTDSDWKTLYYYIGGTREDGRKLQQPGTENWSIATGTNETGFTGLGVGAATGLLPDRPIFESNKGDALWWCSKEINATTVSFVDLYTRGYFEFFQGGKFFGLSVRCIKD